MLARADANPLVIGGGRVDGRRAEAKRYRDLCAGLASDLGGDLSIAQEQLVRRAAGLSVQCEVLEARLVNGGTVDVDELCKLTNTLSRVLGQLGLRRIPRDVTPPMDPHTAALMDDDDDDA